MSQRDNARRWARANVKKVRASQKRTYYKDVEKSRAYKREAGYLRRYGFTRQDVTRILTEDQGGRCAICRTASPKGVGWGWVMDHDHKTNTNRDVLCGLCNVALGAMLDDPHIAMAAASYLLKHKGNAAVAV